MESLALWRVSQAEKPTGDSAGERRHLVPLSSVQPQFSCAATKGIP